MKTYSTAEVARMAGVHRVTLQRWLLSGKLREPRKITSGSVSLRVWTEADVERVRKYKAGQYWRKAK